MSTTNYDSRTADKFVVRLPEGLRDQIDAAAVADDRSMNGVIVQAVKQYLDTQSRQELLLNALANAARTPQDSSVVAQSMHIDDRVKMIVAEPAFLTVVFKLPSLSEAPSLIAQLPYGQKALSTEAVVFGLSTGNLLGGDI